MVKGHISETLLKPFVSFSVMCSYLSSEKKPLFHGFHHFEL